MQNGYGNLNIMKALSVKRLLLSYCVRLRHEHPQHIYQILCVTLQVYLRLYDGDQVSSVSGESDVYSRTEGDPVFCFTSCAVSPQCSDSQYSSMASDGVHGSVDTDYTGCSDMSYTRLNTAATAPLAVPASCLVTLTTPTVPRHTGQPHWHTLEIFGRCYLRSLQSNMP